MAPTGVKPLIAGSKISPLEVPVIKTLPEFNKEIDSPKVNVFCEGYSKFVSPTIVNVSLCGSNISVFLFYSPKYHNRLL